MEELFKLNTNEKFTGNDAKYSEILLEPFFYFNIDNKGFDFRKRYIQVFNYWMKLDETEVEFTMDFFYWFHGACLITDDILDSSEQRRGNPTAHLLYGAGRTIIAADFSSVNFYLTGKVNPSIEVLQEPFKIEIFETMKMNNIIQAVCEGQATETYWRDNYTCPSEEHYLYMLNKKGGHWLLAISNFMQVFTKTNIDVSKLSLLLGTYFQLADDYRGLTSNVIVESKGFCDDLRDGKFTLPIIHAIKSRPNDKRLIGILKMHTNDIDLKKKCLELLEEFGSMEFTKNKINYYKNLIKQEIQRLGLNDHKFKILFELHNYDH